MTTDDDMREIEAALDDFLRAAWEGKHCARYPRKAAKNLLALIRQKMDVAQKPATCQQPEADVAQNDDEHERAVEAWRKMATSDFDERGCFRLMATEIDEGVRLMRAMPASDHPVPKIHGKVAVYVNPDNGSWARPATGKDDLQVQAAGELLRAAKDAVQSWPSGADEINALRDAVEAAERAGIGKNLPT